MMIEWIISIVIIICVLAFVWWMFSSSMRLDSRIAIGDESLLKSSSTKIEEVIRAPPGSTIHNVVPVVVQHSQPAFLPGGQASQSQTREE